MEAYTQNGHTPPKQDTEDTLTIDIRSIWRKFRQYWYWFAVALIIAYAAANIYLRYATPLYRAAGTVLVKTPQSNGAVNENVIFGDIGMMHDYINLENEIEILTSRSLMELVIRELGLEIAYFSRGRIRERELYLNTPVRVIPLNIEGKINKKELEIDILNESSFALIEEDERRTYKFGEAIVTDVGTLTLIPTGNDLGEGSTLVIRFFDPVKLATRYAGNLTVKPQGTSMVLELSLNEEVGQKAEDIINKVFEIYAREEIEDKNRIAENTLTFIDDRLKLLTRELSSVERGVEDYKTENEIPVNVENNVGLLLSQIQNYDEQLLNLEIQLNILQMIEESLEKDITELELIPTNLGGNAESLAGSIGQYNTLLLERDHILKSASPENPVAVNLTNQLYQLRGIILENIGNIKRDLEISIRTLNTEFQQLDSRIRQAPRQERELLEISRQQKIKETLYLFLLQKREETALTKAASVANSKILDEAMVSGVPVEPKSLGIYAASGFLSILLTLIIVFLREQMVDTIQSDEDIKSRTQAPILGSIALERRIRDVVVVKSGSRSGISEMFRLLRTNLNFLLAQNLQKRLLITSSISGEGKTFIAVNLGMTLALSRKKTLLIGLDLRKPKLEKYLGYEERQKKGITNYLIGEATLSDIIVQSKLNDHLFFIGSGPLPPNPAEIIMNPRMGELFAQLEDQFDYILIDTPPVGIVTDALLLSDYVNTALYVVRNNVTSKEHLEIIEDLRKHKKLPNLAIVYNGLTNNKGYRTAYSYGYGYGYYQDEKKKKRSIKEFFTRK